MIIEQNRQQVITFLLATTVGLVGAFGQAALLHNELVHSYPYKMMDMPPWDFYRWIGNIGYYIAVLSILIALAFSTRLRRYFVAAIPVAICPIAYLLTFEIAFLFSPYQGEIMLERNFEGYTGETVRYAFRVTVLGLMFWGTVIGLIAGLIIEKSAGVFKDKFV